MPHSPEGYETAVPEVKALIDLSADSLSYSNRLLPGSTKLCTPGTAHHQSGQGSARSRR
jgi:hypothetical protein